MVEVAAETLTFLFTDLEGSTRLWEEHPDAMRVALGRHDELVRSAVEAHGGKIVKTTGDGALATFGSAQDGVGAAVAAQAALAGTDWPEGIDLRVRMGIHAGHATERAGDYFGPDVNRAARVMAVAHGGQIVCSAVVGEFVRDQFALVDLGSHRLRDLQSAVHLFQVEVPGLPSAFPPLRSLDAYRSNLPYELSSFVGREGELRSVADLMGASRVVSIVGVGGVGKTRLALQVGSELLPHYPDGVWLCELASILEPDDLPDAVAASLGYTPPQGVSVAEGLPRFLERKELLLILDNCEHLVGVVASFVTATTTFAAHISVLATSREALGVRGEHISPLSSLGVPAESDAASVLASESGALFVARASEARGDFVMDDANARAVHDLCERLDGIPLAIELAAAQTAMMTPDEIHTRLDRQFRLLTGGRRTALERHQTLRAAIDWSYDLLDDDERAFLDRLSVCVGGFDLDAAAAIAAGTGADELAAFELLGSLVAKSLVERNERDGVTRYRLLEMIRQYAAERLNATKVAEDARDDHARHYLSLATRLFAEIATEADYDALERLDTETPNIAAGGRWLLDGERLPELMGFFRDLPFMSYVELPATTLDELGDIAGAAVVRSDVSALPGFPNACFVAATRAFVNGDAIEYRAFHERAKRSSDGESAAQTLIMDSTVARFDGDLERALSLARRFAEHARAGGDPTEVSWSLAYLAVTESPHDPESALANAEAALAVARGTGSAMIRLYPLMAVTNAAWQIDPQRALEAAEECVRIDHTRRRAWSTTCQARAAKIRVVRGETAEGLILWRDTLRQFDHDGERILLSIQVASLADALARTEPSLAVELAAIAESDVIAPFATFTTQPELIRLADELAPSLPAARARAATMSYDDAIGFVFDAIDRLVTEHGPPTFAQPA